MGLREDAIAAAVAAQEQRETVARAILADRLAPAPVDGLTIAEASPQLVVFADAAGLFLAVRDQAQPPRVCRVTGTAGEWTEAPRTEVDSLATLGLILAAETEA